MKTIARILAIAIAALMISSCSGDKKPQQTAPDTVRRVADPRMDADVERYWEEVIEKEGTLDEAHLQDAANHALQLLEHVDAVLAQAEVGDDVADSFQLAMEAIQAPDTAKGVDLYRFVTSSLPPQHELVKRLNAIKTSIVQRVDRLQKKFTPQYAATLAQAAAILN